MKFTSAADISVALSRVGELLAYEREYCSVVVLGGAAINLRAVVDRATSDVDILAFTVNGRPGPDLCVPPAELPAVLARAIATVARDTGLEPGWMNTGPALQWEQGMPEGLGDRLHWLHFGPAGAADVGLNIGLVDRYDLIFFKLYAAADHATTRSVHYRDLLALAPSVAEIEHAAVWVKSLNASPEYFQVVDELVVHVRADLRED
jgi:hypothetical protein